MKIGSDKNESKINAVKITHDTLSNRGGLSIMLRYLDNIGIYSKIEEKFGYLRKSSKGESIGECAASSWHCAWMVPDITYLDLVS
ncbi:MAG: hypothetical protein GX640_18795 [Fibrobacter sp.]|nr:hypothetical protein [Fibrobacter sp.]